MKKIIIGKCMSLIKKYYNYDDTKLAEIEYGLTALYLTFSKLIIIFIIACIINCLKEVVIFLCFFNILRTTSFGIHATKSWICLITSIAFFIGLPLICFYCYFSFLTKLILGIVSVFLIFKNSPADTKKRPIINKRRRKIYKFITTFSSIIYLILSLVLRSNFISNSLLFSMILQNVLISPLTYKLFKQPYNNYKKFLELNPDFLT